MPREQGRKLVAQNKKARHDYSIEDVYEAGMVLTGTEVKSLRAGRASLVDGYATLDDGEIWLRGVHIPEYTLGTWTNHEPRRPRKLLLNRTEVNRIAHRLRESGRTLRAARPLLPGRLRQGGDRRGAWPHELRQAARDRRARVQARD